MSRFQDSIRCPCPVTMRTETVCSFVNDVISIEFTVGKFDNETLREYYPGLDLDLQQFYIYKPSELFEESVDTIITKESNGRNNLQCSYELFDECYTSDGLLDGCFNTSDSFACKYDASKVKDGLFDSLDSFPFSIYDSKMPLKYKNSDNQINGSFRHTFDVGDNPGTYCVNATTYKILKKPSITFWDQTPLTKRHPYSRLSLPGHEFFCWIGITSVSLIVFGSIYYFLCDDSLINVTTFIPLCLLYDAFELIALSSDAEESYGAGKVSTTLGAIYGSLSTLGLSSFLLYSVSDTDESFLVLSPFVFTKLFYFIKRNAYASTEKSIIYYLLGSVMNDLVFYKYDVRVLFYVTSVLNLIAWCCSIGIAFYCSPDSRKKAFFIVSLVTLYFIVCLLIELSFVPKKSEFLDVFYKDSLIIIYSRLDDILIIAYICGNVLWKTFGQHYKFCKSRLAIFS